MGDYIPQNVTGRTFEEIHPKGEPGVSVEVGDRVTVPDDEISGVWIVTGFRGDFAALERESDGRKFAYRRGRLEKA